jgi:predicted Zn-dependent protease
MLIVLAPVGCQRGPRAPVLVDEPLYQSSTEGIRFQVPDGWTQHARGEFPPGPVSHERMLVEYRRVGAEQIYFRVTLVDLPASTDLQKYTTERLPGGVLRLQSPPEPVEVDGVAGTHFALTRNSAGEPVLMDVYAFRRGDRNYLFTGAYPEADTQSRQQVRRAVEGIQWKK